MVDDLVDHLNAQGYSADRLHGDMSQAMRDRVMNKFRKSGLEFLVATDVAARGIDVDDVQVVFNYDLPYDGEDYVHRIGRTGRKGRSGMAISFASGREVFAIRNIERYTNMRIHRAQVPTANEVEDARANVIVDKLRTALQSGAFQRQDHLIERLLEEGFNSTDIASALLHLLQGGEAAAAGKARAARIDERRPEHAPRPATSPGPQRPCVGERDRPRRDARGPGSPRPTPQVARAAGKQPAVPAPKSPAPPPVAVKPPAERTYSDAEILASVAPEPAKAMPARPDPKSKGSRRTPDHQTRLYINIGEAMGIAPIDIVNAVAGHTGLPGKVVGTVDVREKHLFVDVDTQHAKGIIAKLNRAEIKGRKVKVKAA
jgi:ATP-dependent RNA helicase DeaD